MDEEFTYAIGPLMNNFGRYNWNVFLGDERIVACPYTLLESFKLRFRHQLKIWPADPGAKIRQLVDDEGGITEAHLPHGRALRRYPLNLLKGIVVTSRYMTNTITEDVYKIVYRHQTDWCREVLSEYYPSMYQEKDFPTTALGRILKK